MAIPTSRTKEKGQITVIREKCTGCGLCVSVCKDFSLFIKDSKVELSETSIFGCTGCGHCMAICPENAILITGREISPNMLFELPPRNKKSDYNQLLYLMESRRSIREFKNKAIESSVIQKILDAARTAPMGLPPSDVNVLILDDQNKVRKFANDFCLYLEKMKWLVSPWFLSIMRPFWGKSTDEMFRMFILPLFKVYIDRMKKGENVVTYDAPLAMYFYGSRWCDPADPIIAATYAMLAAESLGLGSCMLGGIHPLIQMGRKAEKFREKYQIRNKSREGIMIIFGYPSVKYTKGIKRTFASEIYYN